MLNNELLHPIDSMILLFHEESFVITRCKL